MRHAVTPSASTSVITLTCSPASVAFLSLSSAEYMPCIRPGGSKCFKFGAKKLCAASNEVPPRSTMLLAVASPNPIADAISVTIPCGQKDGIGFCSQVLDSKLAIE